MKDYQKKAVQRATRSKEGSMEVDLGLGKAGYEGPKCEAVPLLAECKCEQGHATQQECYNWPCPCAAEARAYFFKHKAEIETRRAKEIASIENPMCARCDKRLAAPGYPFCQVCIDEAKSAPKVMPEGIRQIEVE